MGFLVKDMPVLLMIDAIEILDFLKANGFAFATGVPCSYFSRLISVLEDHDLQYIPATREDEAIGIASGIALGSSRCVVIMQNSGYATIGDALTSLAQLYKLPMLIFVSWRGLEPDRDFPEHSIMGQITEEAMKAYRVPFWVLQENDWRQALIHAVEAMDEAAMPVALLVKEGVM